MKRISLAMGRVYVRVAGKATPNCVPVGQFVHRRATLLNVSSGGKPKQTGPGRSTRPGPGN